MPLSLYLLALATFAMGTSEFMLAGLVPDIAGDLDVTLAQAGSLTAGYAVGMILGAPAMAALARTWPRRPTLTFFLIVFIGAHALGAWTDSFGLLFGTRAVAAIANAGFLAVAMTTATRLVAADRKARALAILLGGTTIACVVGVPGGALLASAFGWRATFAAIALLCAPAVLGVLVGVPSDADDEQPSRDLRGELAQLTRPRLLSTLALGALVNAATFCTFTYLAPVATDLARLATLWVPVVLVVFGAGSFLGVTVSGRFADRHPTALITVGGGLLAIGWVALALTAHAGEAVLVLSFVQGTLSFAVGSTLIARVLYEATGAPTMGGSYATVALNLGAAAGPTLGGATISGASGLTGPIWTSAILVAVALATALPMSLVSRARRTGVSANAR